MHTNLSKIQVFSLRELTKCQKEGNVNRAWKIVLAATIWTAWLARNKLLFSSTRIRKADLEFLITERVSMWGRAANIINCGKDPLWLVNPQGTLAIYHHNVSIDFWRYKTSSFDLFWYIDGAWKLKSNGMTIGSIGGFIMNKKGELSTYSLVQFQLLTILKQRLKLFCILWEFYYGSKSQIPQWPYFLIL